MSGKSTSSTPAKGAAPSRAGAVEFVCGYHAVRHLLARRSHDVLEVYLASTRRPSARLDALRRTCEAAAIAVQPISAAKLERLTGAEHHQGIAARCRAAVARRRSTVAQLCAGRLDESSIVLALDGVMDPRNLGACLRVADATGVTAVVLPARRAAPLNATAGKVAGGALESLEVLTVTNLARSLGQLQDAGCQVIGAAADAGQSIYDVEVRFPAVLVAGAEQGGMRRNTRRRCDTTVSLPMLGAVESLNVSVAVGVCLYELRRRASVGGAGGAAGAGGAVGVGGAVGASGASGA